jgi:hypothetical protein
MIKYPKNLWKKIKYNYCKNRIIRKNKQIINIKTYKIAIAILIKKKTANK